MTVEPGRTAAPRTSTHCGARSITAHSSEKRAGVAPRARACRGAGHGAPAAGPAECPQKRRGTARSGQPGSRRRSPCVVHSSGIAGAERFVSCTCWRRERRREPIRFGP
ncbi:hypothetical protein FM103_11450 [Corynebacterium xerosis]|nr:hypothetical protein FM103_11450 [Corynebacterium xerosis]